MDGTQTPLLQIAQLQVGRIKPTPTLLLDGIHLAIPRGKTLALVGESGSGKSLTALSIMQLLPPSIAYGEPSVITLDNIELTTLSERSMQRIRGARIGMIFQEPMTALNPVMRVGAQIAEGMRLHLGYTKKQAYEKTLSLLTSVGIKDPKTCYHHYPHQLSGGMKQRVVIAMALAAEPELIIADEPTTAVDVTIQKQILQLLNTIKQQRDLSILFITHDLGVVAAIADDIAVMHNGKIVEQAPVTDFMRAPQHPYSKQLFAALPTYNKRGEYLSTQHSAATVPLVKASISDTPCLTLQDVCVHIPIRKGILQRQVGTVKAVDGVSLTLYPGETFALVGESGCGKTTLAKAIMGLMPMTAGQIDCAPQLHKQIIFQDPYSSLNPKMLIADILAEGLRARGEKIKDAAQHPAIQRVVEQVRLPLSCLSRYPHEFSGGQRQRIAIARAVILSPQVIICDEPTSALDLSVQAQVLNLLRELQAEYSLSYLFITHNFSVVAYLADRVAVMEKGKIVEHGSVENVLFHPEHAYTKALLAAVPYSLAT